MGEDEDGHGRDTGEGDTSSTLGQAQSIEVCFGRTKLTLCRPVSPDLPLPSTQLPPTSPFLLIRPSKRRCLLFE